MAVNEEIEFTIRPDGSVEYTIRGIQGSSCDDLSKIFESLGEIEKSVRTGEYYENESDVQLQNRQRR